MKIPKSVPMLFLTGVALVAVLPSGPAVAGDDAQLSVYGYVKADAIYDFKRVDPDWNSTLRPSKIRIPDPGNPAAFYEDGEFVTSVKSTRVGANFVRKTTGPDIVAKLELDFYGTGSNAGQFLPRLRHAYVSYGQLLVGQAWSLFSSPEAFPMLLDFWGPCGVMASRRPQIRWTPLDDEGSALAVALEKPGAGVDMGRGPSIDPQFNAVARSVVPDLTAMYRLRGDWGFVQIAGVVRQLGYEGNTSDTGFSGTEFGGGGNLHGRIRTGSRNGLLFQIAAGAGIADYANDGGVDISGDGQGSAEALGFMGWSLGYDAWWNDRWSTSLAASQTIQDNSGGQTGDAFEQGTYAALNLVYHPQSPLLYGLEFIWGDLELNDGRGNDDYRIQFSGKFAF